MTNANSAGHSTGSAAGTAVNPVPARPKKVSIRRLAYGLYAWLEFTLMAVVALLALLPTPGLTRRRTIARTLARAALRMAGMRLEFKEPARLPTPCIVVANHCSYIDGVVLTAALPPSFSFVIKREMSRFPLAATLLRRIGSEFVERSDRKVGARDTRRLLRSAAKGQAMAFFPEGTFSKEVGVLRFHIGAFAAAARARLPVVPVVIRGTRHTLPADSFWPNPGPIEVEVLSILPAIHSGDPAEDGDVAVKLRNAARLQILNALGEPDLANDTA
jgi:1-acyl-sn-glycerol-3-phosphate acyltransferase